MKTSSNLKKWVEDQYSKVSTDPWGLDWRPSQQYRYLSIVNSINKYIDRDEVSIADIGCATGVFTNYLHKHCLSRKINMVGIDISETAVNRARKLYPDIDFIQSDIDQFSVDCRQSQDVVICLETLYYIDPDKRSLAVSSLSSCLRNNGILVLSSLNQPPPYLNQEELVSLVQAMELVEVGLVNVKPVIFLERLIIKLDRLLGLLGIKIDVFKKIFCLVFNQYTVNMLAGIFTKILPIMTVSHYYVIARVK